MQNSRSAKSIDAPGRSMPNQVSASGIMRENEKRAADFLLERSVAVRTGAGEKRVVNPSEILVEAGIAASLPEASELVCNLETYKVLVCVQSREMSDGSELATYAVIAEKIKQAKVVSPGAVGELLQKRWRDARSKVLAFEIRRNELQEARKAIDGKLDEIEAEMTEAKKENALARARLNEFNDFLLQVAAENG
ncbi:hypothetical protein HYT45_01635 [Candidatus Uhrbacteria bacterium]|nr:hypothetical protein [Candidatus Uhrbacteria bacterium]